MANDLETAVDHLVSDSLAMRKAVADETQSIQTVLDAVKKDWNEIINAINLCSDSEFQNASPSGALASVIAKLSGSVRTWNALIRLKKVPNKNLQEIGAMANDAVGYLSSFRSQILGKKFRSKVEAQQRLKDMIAAMNSRLNDKIKKEIEIDSFVLNS